MQISPPWWEWELELSPHVLQRMSDRQLSEVELRLMLEDATGYHDDIEPGRFVIEANRHAEPWEVIVEPDELRRVQVVVTAYYARK